MASFTHNSNNPKECTQVQARLSDYLENALSARQTLEIESHLAVCADCTEASRQMQATVALLRTAPRHDTADDFMARLHARLDTLEPQPVRNSSPLGRFRDWLAGLWEPVPVRRLPALGAGLATAGLAFVLIAVSNHQQTPITKSNPITGIPSSMTAVATETLQYHVAESTRNPLADPAAENLQIQYATKENVARQDADANSGSF